MKKMKKVAGMSLAMVMGVTSAAGCGTSAVKMPEEPSEIAKLATERTNALKSYELSGTAKIDVEYLLNQLRNERYVMAIRRLILEDAEPKDVAEEMGVTVDNLYNIKKRVIAALTQIVLNDGRAQYER